MYGCPGCGGQMIFDIGSQRLHCSSCGRTEEIRDADAREARTAGNSFSAELMTCPGCGASILAFNAALASFCSYCGASVLLERKDARMDCPDAVYPFQITREQCFEKYRSLLAGQLFVDHRLRKKVRAESFRGIYVPYFAYSAAVRGEAEMNGVRRGRKYTSYYRTKVRLDHHFTGILHDASAEMPDSQSERICRVDRSFRKPFSPAYLSGFFADLPDTDSGRYLPMVNAEAARFAFRDTETALHDGCSYRAVQEEMKLIPLTDARYEASELIPVWFMSVRSGSRILYAIQNGITGEMSADMPLDLPRIAMLIPIVALPMFLLMNLSFTLRPELIMSLAMVLALIAQFAVNRRLTCVKDRQRADRGEPFDTAAHLKKAERIRKNAEKKPSAKKEGKGVSVLRKIGIGLGALVGFLILLGFLRGMQGLENRDFYAVVDIALTAAMGALLIFRRRERAKQPAGSLAAFGAMLAGCVLAVFNPFHSSDEAQYAVSLICVVAVIWESTSLLLLYNRECSDPLPEFSSHRGGKDSE